MTILVYSLSFLIHRGDLGACGGLKKDHMSEKGNCDREGLSFLIGPIVPED